MASQFILLWNLAEINGVEDCKPMILMLYQMFLKKEKDGLQ